MSTSEFLSYIQEYRSIIWFFVFLLVFAVLMFSAWAFARHVDEKGSSDILAPDNRFNDDWD